MRWRRRTDDARRTKGDPPPTVDQLLVTVRQQGELVRYLGQQRAELLVENARLRDERAEYVGQLTRLVTENGWLIDAAEPFAVDEDVTRAYVPEYEAWGDELR